MREDAERVAPWPAAVAAGWHPVASLAALARGRPLARRLMGRALVVFAGETGPAVLADRCPHRAMPLSRGRIEAGAVVCPYHGWRFSGSGACLGVTGSPRVPEARVPALPVHVAAGLVWTSLAEAPPAFPALPAAMLDEGLDRFWWELEPSRARLLDALENHLDPAHPHHLHPFIVRAPDKRRPVEVSVSIHESGAEAVYREEGVASGLLPRLLEGHRTTSIGRLFPPLVGEVAFEGPSGLKLSIAVVFVPEDRGLTRPLAHFATKPGRVPAPLKRFVLKAFHRPILAQDRRALAAQAEAIERAGEGRYAMGPLDFLGPAIWAFANGRAPEPKTVRETVYL